MVLVRIIIFFFIPYKNQENNNESMKLQRDLSLLFAHCTMYSVHTADELNAPHTKLLVNIATEMQFLQCKLYEAVIVPYI